MATLFKKTAKIVFAAAVLVLVLFLAQRLLIPKYVSELPEGALIREYYMDKGGHDIIFLGDCEVYSSYDPAILEEEFGLTSFIRGSAAQRIWQSLCLLEETLDYETPKAVIYDVLPLIYSEKAREEYNRLTIDGMKWSSHKKDIIRLSMNDGESFITYVFPILRYHNRWNKLKKEDFRYIFGKLPTVSDRGYLRQEGTDPAKDVPKGAPLGDYTLPNECMEYLNEMRRICEEHGIELILVKAPTLYPYWYPEWDEQVRTFAADYGLTYYNYLDRTEEIGIDFEYDTYDKGQHLNTKGAAKLTEYLGRCLTTGEDLGYRFTARNEESGVEVSVRPGESFDGFPEEFCSLLSYYEAESCAFEGTDKIYTYGDAELRVCEDRDNLLYLIRLTSDKYRTEKGICIGMSGDKVTLAYGETEPVKGEYRYRRGDTELAFIMEGNTVVSIEYRLLD